MNYDERQAKYERERAACRKGFDDMKKPGYLKARFDHTKEEHGFRHPAGSKARKALAARNLKPSPKDEVAMRNHIDRCVKGMRRVDK